MASKIEHFVASDGWQYADMADFLLGKKEWCDHNFERRRQEERVQMFDLVKYSFAPTPPSLFDPRFTGTVTIPPGATVTQAIGFPIDTTASGSVSSMPLTTLFFDVP